MTAPAVGPAVPAGPGAAPGVIAAMFGWPWTAIAAERTTVLGPGGYGAVQISPPEEAVVLPGSGYPWWQAYQPVSYALSSRFGTQAQLAAMISSCHAAGVKVYADVSTPLVPIATPPSRPFHLSYTSRPSGSPGPFTPPGWLGICCSSVCMAVAFM